MSLNFKGIRAEASGLLRESDFSEGLVEFRRLLSQHRVDYLGWRERKPFVQWTYDNINLTSQESSRAGPMRLSVYQREIGNNVFHNPDCRQVTALKGVQIGYSKGLRAIYGYAVEELAKRVSVTFPVTDDMKRFFKDELALLHSSCAAVSVLLRENKRGEVADSMSEYRYKNGSIAYYRAAHNEDDLQGFTSWLQIADEADRSGWLPRGNSAGDKVSQLRNRGTDFHDSKLIIGSTPGIRDISVIWREWETSDKRMLEVKCPHCRQPQILRWGGPKTRYGFKYTVDQNHHVSDVYYQCDSPSKCRIDETVKEEMIDAGVYKPTAIAKVPGNVGVHIPSWLSMSPGAAWSKLAQEWVNAQGDPEKLKEFVTFKMAEPWDELGQGVDQAVVASLFKPYSEEVPDDVVLLTAGGDTQLNKEGKGTEFSIPSREFSVVGWTRFGQMRVIGHWKFLGTPGEQTSDAEVRNFLGRQFKRRDGKTMQILATAMDSNGGFAEQVRGFCASFPSSRHVWAIIGNNTKTGKRGDYVWPRKPTPGKRGRGSYYRIETGRAKDEVFRLLQYTDDSAPMFPVSMPPDYLDRLLCEERKPVKKTGGYHWDPKRGRRAEEEWVCLAYAYAALKGLQMIKLGTWGDLNVAGGTLGIPKVIHDPETGEIGYHGMDMSAHAQERRAIAGPLLIEPETPRAPRRGDTVTAQAEERKAAPPPAPVAQPPKQVAPKAKKVLKQFKSSWGRGW